MKYFFSIIFCTLVASKGHPQLVHNIESKVGGKMSAASYLVDTIIEIKEKPFFKEIIFQHIDSTTVYTSPFKCFLEIYLQKSIRDSVDYFFIYNPTSDSIIYTNRGEIYCYEYIADKNGDAKNVEFYFRKLCGTGIWSEYLISNQLMVFYDNNCCKKGGFKTKAKLMFKQNGKTYKSNTFSKQIDENIFYFDRILYDANSKCFNLYNITHNLFFADGCKFTIDGIRY